MDSISPECQQLKVAYDDCFRRWFPEFLKGSTKDPCTELYKQYTDCVKDAAQKKGIALWELEKSILGTSEEKKAPANIKK